MTKTASPRRPQFFKVFLPEHSSDHLKIPLAFVHHIGGGGGSLNTVSLKGPGGGVWYTDLVTNSGGELFFGKGWKEFISDHSVQLGDFLVFEYAGNMRFNVLVFDHSACEKEASLLARPPGDTFSPKRKRGRQPGKKFNEKQSAKDNSLMEAKDNSLLETATPRAILGKKLDTSIETNASVLQARELSMCSTTLEVEKMPPSGEVPLSGKRRNGLISQRRPVTLEEVTGVRQKANAFKSEHPFCIIQMRDSYVYFSFALNVPTTFAREHLPWPRGNVILWDPSGKRWEVKSLPHGGTTCFSAGWRKFSIANNLETGDVCVFEAIEKYEMKVNILRVVEEITPLISQSRGRIKQPFLGGQMCKSGCSVGKIL